MKYIHKPTEVEAIQYTGDNEEELLKFISPTHIYQECKSVSIDANGKAQMELGGLKLKNANGYLDINKGDYVIKGEKEGDYWTCSSDVFEKSYEVKE